MRRFACAAGVDANETMSNAAGKANGPADKAPDGPADKAPDGAAGEERELLLDHEARVEAVEGAEPFGRLGRPFDRRSPFRNAFIAGLGLAAAYVVAWSVFNSREVLLLIGLAFMIAVGLEPAVTLMTRHGLPRPLAVLVVSLAAVAIFGGFLALAIPPFVEEINHFANHAPHYLHTLSNRNSFIGHVNSRLHLESHLKKALSGGGITTIASGVVGAGKLVLGVATAIIVVIVLTIYFLADLPHVTRVLYRLVPRSRRARAGLLIDEALGRVGGYMLGNFLTSLIAGLGTFIWLEIFGVPYPLLLGVFVAFMDLVPIVGSTIGGIIVSLVALTVSVPIAGATAVFYVVYRNAEDYLLTPRVMNRTVDVPGLVTVIAVLIGGILFGIIGALIAIPVAAGIKLVLDEVAYPRLDAS
jgi:predicted PurR-regulated permease PerM